LEFNRGRPTVDREEKRRVKRNLFGGVVEKGEKSSVSRKLRAKLKAKKKLFGYNHAPYQGKISSQHDGLSEEKNKRMSSWISSSSHHLQSRYHSFQLPAVQPSPKLFSLKDETNSRHSAWIPRTQSPVIGVMQDMSGHQNQLGEISPSIFPPFSSAVNPAKRRGSLMGESLTTLEFYHPSSPQKQKPRSSPRGHQITECFQDQSLPSDSSFQENKLFSSSYFNTEDSSINTYIPSSTSIATPRFNWLLDHDEWEEASPPRNMDVRFMW